MYGVCALRGLLRQPAHLSTLMVGDDGLTTLDSRKSESLFSWTKPPWYGPKLNPHTKVGSLNTVWHFHQLVACPCGLHNQVVVSRPTKTMNGRTSAPLRLEEQSYFILWLFHIPR